MTLQQLVEGVEDVFGTGIRTKIIKEFDLAQKTLCSEAELLEASGSLTDVTSYTSWALPSGFVNLKQVDFYDTNGEPLYIENLSIDFEIYNGYIYFMSTTSTPISSMPTSIAYIILRYNKMPSDLDSITSTVDIDEVEYPAMEAFVMKRLYSKTPMTLGVDRDGNVIKGLDYKALSYWSGEYTRLKIQAKRRKNILDSTMRESLYYSHTGGMYFLKKNKETTVNVISIPSYSTLYSKYVRLSATSPSTLTEIQKIGFGDLSYAMDGNDVVITSTAEFTATMWMRDNQHSAYSYVSTSEVRFTPRPELAWGTTVIELWIY